MPARIPKSLKQKRNELTGQRQNLVKAIQKIDREIRTLDYAIKLIAPDWQPPTGLHRTYKANKFRRGVITKACLEVIVHLKDQLIIPADDGQGFQSIVDSDSSGTWTGLWPDRGQFAE